MAALRAPTKVEPPTRRRRSQTLDATRTRRRCRDVDTLDAGHSGHRLTSHGRWTAADGGPYHATARFGVLVPGNIQGTVHRQEVAMSDDHVTDTDVEPGTPHGVGESVTRQGNTLAHGGPDEAHQDGATDRDDARANASQPDREQDRLQGSIDPQRPSPDPGDRSTDPGA